MRRTADSENLSTVAPVVVAVSVGGYSGVSQNRVTAYANAEEGRGGSWMT